MIFFWTGAVGYNVVPSVLINMFCLLASIAIGLYLQKRQDQGAGNALNDIKNGLSAGLPYALIVSVFIYFYYSEIDPGFNEHQIAEAQAGIEKVIADPDQLAEVKESNADFEVMTDEEIFEEMMQGPRSFYKPTAVMTVSMLAMLLLGTLNSIFITIIYRKIVFR